MNTLNDLRIIYDDVMLVLPAEELREDICAFKDECLGAGEKHIQGSAHLEMYELRDWLKRVQEKRRLPVNAGSTPAETYLAYSRETGRLLGCCQLRTHLTDSLKKCGANIGYEIRPSERKKGYGKKMLMALLSRGKHLGMKTVYIDCDINNIASKRTIQACGGGEPQIMTVKNDTFEETICRFRIDL